MRGLSGFKKQQPQKLMLGGMVRGPGTGTSDSIQTAVPEGSYIMPADSTQAIGAKGLSGLGKPVPVNLSNGEYHLPPEQVHGLGLQVLDQMKAATHTPVSPDEVQRPNGFGLKPQMFFADGGAIGKPKPAPRLGLHRQSFVDGGATWNDEQRTLEARTVASRAAASSNAQQQQAPTTSNSGFGRSVSSGLNWAMKNFPLAPDITPGGKAGLGVRGIAALVSPSVDAVREGLTSALGGDPATLPGGQGALSNKAFSEAQQQAAGFNTDSRAVSDAVSKAGLDILGAKPRDKMPPTSATPSNASSPPLVSAVSQPQQVSAREQAPQATATSGPSKTGGLNFPDSAGNASLVPPSPGFVGGLNFPKRTTPNGWTHTGIGSGSSQIVGRVGQNGVPEFTNDATAVSGAAAMPDNGIGKVGGLNSGRTFTQMQPGDSARARDEMNRAIDIRSQTIRGLAASEPNGLTIVLDSAEPARQARTQQIQASSGLNSRAARAQAGLAIQAQTNQLRAAELAQQGDISHQGLGLRREELAGQRQDSTVDQTLRGRGLDIQEGTANLTNQRTRQQLEEGSLSLDQQRELQAIRTKMLTATDPSEREQLMRQYQLLSGSSTNRFTVVPGGQEVIDGQLVTRPSIVINNQTGQRVDLGGQAVPAQNMAADLAQGKRIVAADPSKRAEVERRLMDSYGRGLE